MANELTGKAPEHPCYVYAKLPHSREWDFIVYMRGTAPFMEGIVVMTLKDPFDIKRRAAQIVSMGNLIYGPEIKVPDVPEHLVKD